MTAAPIAFRSNPGRYSFIGTTDLVNCYAEKMDQDAKAPLAVLPCEGLVGFSDTEAGPCRGMIRCHDEDHFYSIHPSSAYRIDADGTATRIGTVPGVDPVQMSCNQKDDPQIVVVSEAMVQVIESDSLSVVLDVDLPSPVVSADYVSGYTVYLIDDQRFFLSGINDSKEIDILDFDRFKQRPGTGRRVIEYNGELLGFGSNGSEVWRNTGNADFPFDPIAFPSRGLLATHAVARCDNTLMFPGEDHNIYRLDNYNPIMLQSNDISRKMESDTDAEAMLGFGFDRGGHKFACFKGSDWSRCYDAATQTWHTRQSYTQTKWRAQYSVTITDDVGVDRTIVGDALSGKLFYLDRDTYTEDGETFVWKVISPPLHVFPNGAILDAVHFDLATGFGTMSGQGSNPKVMLRTSVDGGNTFNNYRELELGTTGNYRARITARRLGRFGPRGVVFELSISDPVARALVGCDVELRQLKR